MYSYENPSEEGFVDEGRDLAEEGFVGTGDTDEDVGPSPVDFDSHATFLSDEGFSVLTVDVDELVVVAEEDVDEGFKDEFSVAVGEDCDPLPHRQDPPALPMIVYYMEGSDMVSMLEGILTRNR